MTPDAQGPGPDDTPTPPAQTRWTEEGAPEEDGLLPPYMPGRTTGEEAAASADREAGEPFPFETETTAEEPFPFETDAPGEDAPGDEPFPFETGAPGEDAPVDEPFPFETETAGEGAATDEPFPFEADEPEAQAPTAGAGAEADMDAGDPFPFEAEAAGPSTVEPEVADTAEEAFPFEATEPEEGDDFPFDAFDLGGDAEAPAKQPEMYGGAEGLAGATGSATEVADRLEWLAQTLRTEGRAGLEREAATGERLTSLIAGVLAGYLAGRGD